MADTTAVVEYSMTEVATHTTKESTWLVIKDMNDGGTLYACFSHHFLCPGTPYSQFFAPDFVGRTYPSFTSSSYLSYGSL